MKNKHIKEGVKRVMKNNTSLLTKPNYQDRIMFLQLTENEGIDHRVALLMVKNYKLLATINRRIRLEQELHPNYRDSNWEKRQRKSKEVAEDIIEEKK